MELPAFPPVVLYSVPLFILLMVLERVSYWFHPDDDEVGYGGKDTATSLSMGLGSLAFDLLWGIVPALVYAGLYTITPLRVPVEWWALVACLVAQDFFYYWSHRSHHRVRILWASHVVHHSSQRFNLSTALRQPWTGFTSWLFYLPMIALGVHPVALAFCQSVNLVYQFWIHTERIGKLPRPLEAVLNTPSHHRVHHGANEQYLDRNYGGILVIWDRLFGSFEPEGERVRYGLTKNLATFNPVRVAFHEYTALAHDLRAARSWRTRWNLLLRGPGYEPPATSAGERGAGP
jgi:sterol desaturase/sphingolipid hydroxylase (fatty acid hydroxylase superfamily)